MKIKLKDKVKIISGKDKGKVGEVLKVLTSDNKIVVQGVNIVKRHIKGGGIYKESGIYTFEKPIDVSNVMFFDEKENKPSRIGYSIVDGKKFRVLKKTGEVLNK
jgi:large subunit ribosomal protein L24